MNTISFPGLGIENFNLNPVAFTIPLFGGLEIRYYGIIITLGIILAFTYASWRARREGIVFDDVLDIAIFAIIFGIIGARLYYVLTTLDEYDSFYEVIAIWNGGIAIYGALIAGALTVFLVCRYKKLSFLKMADATAPGVMLGQILGRWGNFFNGEAHGYAVSEGSPLYFIRMGLAHGEGRMSYYHPTFLYESLWNLCGFIIINALYKKNKFDGQIVLMYVSWYGFGRMFIEGLRTDSLYIPGTVFRISQVVGFICFVVGTVLLVLGLLRARRARLTAKKYTPAYPKFVTTASTQGEQTDANEEAREAEIEEKIKKEIAPSTPEFPKDISEKLEKLFGTDTENKQTEENEDGKNN